MRKFVFVSLAVPLLFWTGAIAKDWLPDPKMTPGAVNDKITQDNIGRNICKKGWSTKSIRPTSSYTTRLKKQQMAEYGYKDADTSLYEEDHLISLEIGGHPTDPKNLWPQPWDGKYGAHAKDKIENRLHKLVCDGTLTLHQAQHMIATDWVAAYKKYIEEGK